PFPSFVGRPDHALGRALFVGVAALGCACLGVVADGRQELSATIGTALTIAACAWAVASVVRLVGRASPRVCVIVGVEVVVVYALVDAYATMLLEAHPSRADWLLTIEGVRKGAIPVHAGDVVAVVVAIPTLAAALWVLSAFFAYFPRLS